MPPILIRPALPADVPRIIQVRELGFGPGAISRTLFSSSISREASAHRETQLLAELQSPKHSHAVACLAGPPPSGPPPSSPPPPGPPPSASSISGGGDAQAPALGEMAGDGLKGLKGWEEGKVVAYAKWAEYHDEREEAEWDAPEDYSREALGPGTNLEGYEAFFGGLKSMRGRNIGGRGHFILSVLVTSPYHQRIGAGSALVSHLLERMDRVNEERAAMDPPKRPLDCYLEASPAGYSTYSKLGFTDVDVLDMDLTGRFGTVMTEEEKLKRKRTWGEGNAVAVGGVLNEGFHRSVLMVRKGEVDAATKSN